MTAVTPDRPAAEAALVEMPLPTVWLDGTELAREVVGTLGPLRVRQEASAPAVCEVEFDLDPQGARPVRGMALRVRIGDAADDVFDGEVVATSHRLGPDGLHRVRLRAFDRSHRLRQSSAVKAYADLTVGGLAETLAGNHGLGVAIEDDGPRWPRIIQQGESDLDLLSRLVAEAGLWWRFEGDDLHLRGWRIEESHPVTWGIDLMEAEVTDDPTGAADSVRSLGWDPVGRQAWDASATSSDAGAPDGIGDLLGGAGEHVLAGWVFASAEHAEARAQHELDRRVGAISTIRAVVRGDAQWRPGCGITLNDQPDEITGPFLVTSVEHVVDAFSGYLCLISSSPIEVPRASSAGATAFALATVLDIDDPDRAGRVKVQFPALDDVESEWLPVLSLGAGADKGLFCQPDVDDTVLALYALADPGRGVVLGGLYAEHLPGDAAGVADRQVRRFGWNTSDGQRFLINRDGDAIVVSNAAGSTLQLTQRGGAPARGGRSDHRGARQEADLPRRHRRLRARLRCPKHPPPSPTATSGTSLLWLTEDADVRCTHRLGKAPQKASQTWVRIEGRPVLVAPDPVGRPIGGCPHIGVAIKPCTNTLPIKTGESVYIGIDGRKVIRSDLTGFTDGTPPGLVKYEVMSPAQILVGETP